MQVTSSSSRAGRRCPTCHDDLPERSATIDCPSCRAGHHPACWSEGDGCATCGAALRDGADPHDGFDILHLRRRSSDAAPPTTAPLPDRLLVEDDPRVTRLRWHAGARRERAPRADAGSPSGRPTAPARPARGVPTTHHADGQIPSL